MQLAIPLAGAWLGSFYGPLGAQVGWMIGSSFSNKSTQTSQPTVGDLRLQTSQYNIPIPFVMGRTRVSGNIIWAAEKEPYDIKSGGKGGMSSATGKGGQVTGTGYYLSMAILLCEGPIIGISKVWADGQLLIDSSTTAKPLIGTVYLGNTTQNPDPTIESYMGAGNVPAYRGLSYIVLNRFDNGPRPTPPQFSFEVIKEI